MITLRPHHFLCLLGFQGLGYSPAFVKNMSAIVQVLRGAEGHTTPIEVRCASDKICAPCPHRRGQGCVNDAKIRQLDKRHSDILGLQDRQRLSWGAALELLRQKMTLSAFKEACHTCEWQALGLCQAALERLRLGNNALMLKTLNKSVTKKG